MKDKIKNFHENYGNEMRTLAGVFITPPLLALCLFFLVQYYNDQQDIKRSQNDILVELGKIQIKNEESTKKIDLVQASCKENEQQILEIWKVTSNK